jgi:toxin ParE1/3/4
VRELAYTDEARRELSQAATWYDEHGSLGGADFVAAIEAELEQIREMPFAAPPWSYAPRYRARTLRHLPYRVIYEVTDEAVRIAALAHTSRDPEYWLDRLKSTSRPAWRRTGAGPTTTMRSSSACATR